MFVCAPGRRRGGATPNSAQVGQQALLTQVNCKASGLQHGWVDWHLGCRRPPFGIAESGERVRGRRREWQGRERARGGGGLTDMHESGRSLCSSLHVCTTSGLRNVLITLSGTMHEKRKSGSPVQHWFFPTLVSREAPRHMYATPKKVRRMYDSNYNRIKIETNYFIEGFWPSHKNRVGRRSLHATATCDRKSCTTHATFPVAS